MFGRLRLSSERFASFCIALLLGALSLFAKEKPKAQNLWSFDLRGVGYRTDAPNPEYLAYVHRASGLVFVDDSKVLAYFVDVNPTHQLQARGENNRFQLHLLLLNANDSHMLADVSVPTALEPSQVFVASNGRILVLAANVLRSYSSSLQLLSQEALPTLQGAATWIAAVSPAGKTLLLIHPHPADNVVDIFARRADNLSGIRRWRQPGGFRLSCLDDYVYERPSDQLEAAALVRIDTNESTVVHPKLTKPGSWTVSAIPRQGLVFVSSQGLYVGDISGDMQPLGRLPTGFTPAMATASSRNGVTVAVPLIQYEMRPFVIGARAVEFRIQIYDIDQRRLSTELNMKPLAASPTIRVALSPRGEILAVMNSYMLTVHSIGEAARQQQ